MSFKQVLALPETYFNKQRSLIFEFFLEAGKEGYKWSLFAF